MTGATATAHVDIEARPDRVWAALVDPDQIREYMFGSQVTTDWRPGSRITWAGEYEGRKYEDRGEVLEVDPGRHLRLTHYSPLSGQPDEPANYHTLTYDLAPSGQATRVTLTQDNNASPDEVEHSTATWQSMLDGLKAYVEKN